VVSVSIGTSGVVFAALKRLPDERDDAVNLFCHATGGWHAMTVMLSAGGAVRWFRDTVYSPDTSYDVIMRDAAGAPAGSDGLTFLPYLSGERSPHVDPEARGAFIGLGLHHTRSHMARAVVEGVTFGLLDGLNALRRMTGVTPAEVRVTGGGARNPFWRQLLADVFELPVVCLEQEEGPAFGAAILAGVREGIWPSVEEACDTVIRPGDRVEPSDSAVGGRLRTVYEDAYGRFTAAYPALRAARRNQVSG
jgi:xylulokinase